MSTTTSTTSSMRISGPEDLLEPSSRAALRVARRVVIKAGTSVVANSDGSPSLTRLGAIVEQIAELNHAGVEVIFVSSGAVGMGKNLLRKQARLNMSFKDLHRNPLQQPPVAAQVGTQATGLTPSTSIADLLTVNEHMEVSFTVHLLLFTARIVAMLSHPVLELIFLNLAPHTDLGRQELRFGWTI